MKRNDYQNSFLQYIADMQETRVEITLGEHKLYDHEDCEKIRKTGKGLKTDPFIELHDDVCDFIKYE